MAKVTYSKEGYEFDSKYIENTKMISLREDNLESWRKVYRNNSVENGNVKGKYYEVYNAGYEADSKFYFYSNYDESIHFTIIHYK